MKRILRHPLTLALLAWLISLFIRFVFCTSRRLVLYHPDAEPYMRGEKPFILSFWHGRMMMIPCVYPSKKRYMRVLISHHRDGEIIARAIGHFSIGTVRGSSSRGAARALAECFRSLSRGDNITITPDGPRGPFQVAAPGATYIAARSGMPIVPITFSASRHKRSRSWDRFFIALPFSRLVFFAAAPIHVAKDATEEARAAATAQLEASLTAITDTADNLASQPRLPARETLARDMPQPKESA